MPAFLVFDANGKEIKRFHRVPDYEVLLNVSKNINATFIRAPKIIRYGSHINVLAYYNEIPCAVKSGLHVGLSFHPELNNVSIFHEIAFDTLINKKEDLYAA